VHKDKYFYIASTSSFGRGMPSIYKYNPRFSLDVIEDVDFKQVIELYLLKPGQENHTLPASDEYTKVKPVIPDIFYSHYKLALKLIHETTIGQGEFFLFRHSKDWYEAAYYSQDEKNRWSISIDLRDDINNCWIRFQSVPGHKGRPTFRKKASPIPSEKFKQFLALILNFFDDADSIPVVGENFITNFRQLCDGDYLTDVPVIHIKTSYENILRQLKSRKEYLEKSLIERDNDPPLARAKLRGELEGIQYAINALCFNYSTD